MPSFINNIGFTADISRTVRLSSLSASDTTLRFFSKDCLKEHTPIQDGKRERSGRYKGTVAIPSITCNHCCTAYQQMITRRQRQQMKQLKGDIENDHSSAFITRPKINRQDIRSLPLQTLRILSWNLLGKLGKVQQFSDFELPIAGISSDNDEDSSSDYIDPIDMIVIPTQDMAIDNTELEPVQVPSITPSMSASKPSMSGPTIHAPVGALRLIHNSGNLLPLQNTVEGREDIGTAISVFMIYYEDMYVLDQAVLHL